MKRFACCLVLLLGSCTPEETAIQAISCRPHVPDPPSLAKPPAWTPWKKGVDPSATFLYRSPADGPQTNPPTPRPKPTAIDIAANLKLAPGDYVGLRAYGRWYWGHLTGPDGPTSDTLGAIFVDAQGKIIARAKAGLEQPFVTQPSHHDGTPTDIVQDFTVPVDREVVVRIPAGAAKILFSVNDSAFGDNTVAGEFGVTVFQPNRGFAGPASTAEGSETDEPGQLLPAAEIDRLLLADNLPAATAFSFSPIAADNAADNQSQWRGNYPLSGWEPKRSIYAGQRNNQRHWGWDIFAPKGTPLIAPAWPSNMTSGTQIDPKTGTGWGNYAAFTFRYRGSKYVVVYAHLDRVAGGARRINGPELVGYAGCSGLAASDLAGCGKLFEAGASKHTRLDHVHVGLIDGRKPGLKEGNACDPRTVLDWTIR